MPSRFKTPAVSPVCSAPGDVRAPAARRHLKNWVCPRRTRLPRLLAAITAALAVAVASLAGAVIAVPLSGSVAALAQTADRIAPPQAGIKKRVVLRFLTEAAFPPFNFYDEDGILTGFNVDLARAICLEMDVTCDVKARNWEALIPALERGQADALIASHAVTPATVAKVAFTDPYFRTPGRFAIRRDASAFEATPEGLEGRRLGVTRGTTHEAFVKRFFRGSRILLFANQDEMREALRERRVDAIFDDGISLAFWLNGTLSQQCCAFRGGPYLEPRFFGDGIAIAVRKNNAKLKADLNDALAAVRESGRFSELVSRYFPFQIY